MAHSQAELDALRRAYAAGVLRVSVEGRDITYGSGPDLLARVRQIEGEIAITSANPRPVAGKTGFSRGW